MILDGSSLTQTSLSFSTLASERPWKRGCVEDVSREGGGTGRMKVREGREVDAP